MKEELKGWLAKHTISAENDTKTWVQSSELRERFQQFYGPVSRTAFREAMLGLGFEPHEARGGRIFWPVRVLAQMPAIAPPPIPDEKLPLHLLPHDALSWIARVLDHGRREYGERDWETAPDKYTYAMHWASLLRHGYAWWRGEATDTKSGLPHLAHLATRALMLLALTTRDVGKDDRPATETRS